MSGQVVLLENERDEWELPGGRLEAGEDPAPCLAREIAEELGVAVEVEDLVDCWRYPVRADREVLVVTFGVKPLRDAALRLSHEHKALRTFPVARIAGLRMPEAYLASIRAWALRCGVWAKDGQ